MSTRSGDTPIVGSEQLVAGGSPVAGADSVAGADPVVRIAGLRKSFGSTVALAGVDLELRRGETLALLGPSGCGKTTLLRTIAGLERADEGTIEIGGELVEGPGRSVPPERRRLGMVFQDVALFPHLSVAENVAYGIRRRHDRDARVAELLDLVGLPDAGERRPHELSGGMQQRVALARALAPRPAVVLLDEPFANLDLTLRTQLRGELRRVLDATGSSALLVTHDQAEALTLADRVAVIRQGVIDQVDSPERVYAVPATPFVATFIGVANLVRAEVDGDVAATPLGPVRLLAGPRSGRALVVIRPEHVDLEPAPDAADGTGVPASFPGVRGRIDARRFAGAELHYEIVLGDDLRVWVEAGAAARHLTVGDEVGLLMRPIETVGFSTGGDRIH
jgi:iron(III) transport system ATP-binding protein